jgi:hypothetical protein
MSEYNFLFAFANHLIPRVLCRDVDILVILLKDEIEVDRSSRALTVLPSCGSQEVKPANTNETNNSKQVTGKPTVSWAEIASRNR